VLSTAGLKVPRDRRLEEPRARRNGHGERRHCAITPPTAKSTARNMTTLRNAHCGRSDLTGPPRSSALGRDGTFFMFAAGPLHHRNREWRGIRPATAAIIGSRRKQRPPLPPLAGQPMARREIDAHDTRTVAAAILQKSGRMRSCVAAQDMRSRPPQRARSELREWKAIPHERRGDHGRPLRRPIG